jgi:hypothetical protein
MVAAEFPSKPKGNATYAMTAVNCWSAAVAATAVACSGQRMQPLIAQEPTAVKPGDTPIIDCHQHLWDLT